MRLSRNHGVRWWSGVGFVSAALLLGACSDGGGSAATTPTTQPAPTTTAVKAGTAQIGQFEAPASVPCGGKSSVSVPVTYSTTGSARQVLLADGREIPGTEAQAAQINADVHCDGIQHNLTLVAYDSSGGQTTKTIYFATDVNG